MNGKIGILLAGIVVVGFAVYLFTSDPAEQETNTNTPTPAGATSNTNPSVPPIDMKQYTQAPEMILKAGVDYQARLKTNKGDIVIDLHESETPITVNNFVFLAQDGFYTDVPIHRVISGFMLQSGDPTGTGTGTPGYRFNDEPFNGEYTRGTVAMANSGANTNGSQFFIMHQDYPLPPSYVIFGNVIDGLDVVDAIAETPVQANMYGEASVPTETLTIESIEIIEA